MSFNFWEAQRKARSRTTLYVVIFVALTLLVAAGAELTMRAFAGEDYNPPFPAIGLLFLAITFAVAIFQYLMFKSQGGGYVAESVGARRVDPAYATLEEQKLLNIVEEIALAAQLPKPAVYILEAQEINAFAAGLTTTNAAVTVTRGCMQRLSRDELQGVIAHEFGHIYNGDMAISLRLAAMVMGFFFVLYVAMRIMQFSSLQREDRKGPNLVALAALILAIAGSITWFAGSILKSTVSRQREYLADACAVQFTRNPNGIAGALRKIGKETVHDMPSSGMAISHMYLEDTSLMSSLFATHPPLALRISAIEGRKYIPDEWKADINT